MSQDGIIQSLTIAAIIALVADHIAIRTKLATFVTAQEVRDNFAAIHAELGKLASDLAYLRGRSESTHGG